MADAAAPADGRMRQLDHLLNQTEVFAKFLGSRIGAAGSKRRGGGDDADHAGNGKQKKARAAAEALAAAPPATLAEAPQSALVTGGTLRAYQRRGVSWLISLFENGINGILADEMGLGKTVQTIAFLAHLREKNVLGPFLIVAPLSTLDNWVNEFAFWTPTVPAVAFYGAKDDRARLFRQRLSKKVDANYPVVITSYEIILRERKRLAGIHWKYMVVDEGHRLKNFDSKLMHDLMTFESDNRLLLTGTPLQNKLSELWSLMHFLLPTVFNSLKTFEDWFNFDRDLDDETGRSELLEKERNSQIVTKLHRVLRPFLLRRLKTDVESSLPPKKELILYCGLYPRQQYFVQRILADADAQRPETHVEDSVKFSSNNPVVQLRKVCNHPVLLDNQEYRLDMPAFGPIPKGAPWRAIEPPPEDPADVERPAKRAKQVRTLPPPARVSNHPHLVHDCGKLALLDRLLRKLYQRGHRVLIFTQMTRLLDVLEDYFESVGVDYFRLDGGVQHEQRKGDIKRFNNGEGFCFIMSTRAGGLGINLTSADTVIIYDSDYNPQMDLQAQDRVHRIGQRKSVLVFRLVTANSVESEIIRRASSKRTLEKLVIHKERFREAVTAPLNAVSQQELKSLFSAHESDLVGETEITDDVLEEVLDRSGKDGAALTEGKGYAVHTLGLNEFDAVQRQIQDEDEG